jgi:hypothetical protein
MAPPRKERSGPQSPTGNRPAEESVAVAKREGSSAATIRQGADIRRGTARHGGYPVANASQYGPVRGRGLRALSIRCPVCGGVHLARLSPGAVAGGPRRTPCGWVWVVVRRVYGAAS